MNNINDKYWIWFSKLEKIKNLQKLKLIQEFQNPAIIWNLKDEKIKKIKFLDEESINELINKKNRINIEKYQEYMIKNKIEIINLYDKNYPEKLRNIYDKPVTLFAQGNLNLLTQKGIAIIGCRECSEYGKFTARKIAYDVAKKDICIISGLAKGIDKYAHIGALEANGNTIAVIGNGLDNIYPYENKQLYKNILNNNGLIITEYIIGTRPNRMNFPARNRIISGLSEGVVVIEAKEKSGALITADFALEQGREVFAVPGNINNVNSKGTNNLIKQGAYPITDYEDIIYTLKI